ncbi:MAG: YihY/virulence factor BrkB family protein [Acidimicrobiia bacterium]
MDAVKRWIDVRQQRIRPIAFVVGVIKKFGDDRGGRLAALVAYYGFFSLFPALLTLVTVLAFVLEDRPGLREDIESSAIGQFPVIGDSIAGVAGQPLTGNVTGIIVGLVGALWAGLGAMQAAQDAMNEAWGVPRVDNPGFVAKRVRSLVMLAVLGGMLIATSALTQVIAAIEIFGPVSRALLFVGSVMLTSAVFVVAFRVLTVADVTWRQLVPGAVVAGTGYAVLQLVGQWYVRRVLAGAEDTYGTFGVVIGLLSWLYLQAQLTMIGAEVNVVAARGLWPRSLFERTATDADRTSLASKVKEAQIAPGMDVEISFTDAGTDDARPDVIRPPDS